MKPLVSVLVPIYGVECYIEACATSIINQTYTNLEIIFVNDCTKDNSILVLNDVQAKYPNFKHQIRIINHEENLGLAGARMTGIKAANGDFVIQFDSDDYVEPEMIELLVEKAIEDNADIVICDMDYVYENHSVSIHVDPPLNKIELISKLFTGEVHSSLCNKLIRRSLYVENNVLPTIGLNMCEDLSVLYKLLYFSKRISYLPKVLYHYRQNVANSYTAQKMPLKHQLNRIQLLEQIECFLNEHVKEKAMFHDYYKYLVVSNKGEMLLYGDLNYMSFFSKRTRTLTLSDIVYHPNLHKNFKVILILDFFYLTPLVLLIRFLRKLK